MDKIRYKYAVKECEQNLEQYANFYTLAVAGKHPTYVLHSTYIIRHALRACESNKKKYGKK